MRAAVVPALAVALAVALPGIARGASFRSGDEVLIPAGEIVADDLYVAAGTVRIEGRVEGDLVLAAGEADLRGPVGGDLLAAGGNVRIEGPVGGTVRVAGGDVTVAGAVGEDLVAAGGNVTVGPDARIGRDLVAGAGQFRSAGAVGRAARLGAGQATLAGAVAGDVVAAAEKFAVEDGARVGGRLQVSSAEDPRIAPGATIAGGIERTEWKHHRTSPVAAWAVRFVRTFVALAVLGLLLLALTRTGTGRAVEATRDGPLRDLALGLAFLVAAPIACALVFFLGLLAGGWWIGLLLFAAYLAVFAAGTPVAAAAIGHALLARPRPGASAVVKLLVGALVLALLGSIPAVGGAIVALAALVGAGAWIVVFATARTRFPPAAASPPAPGAEAPPAGPLPA